MNGNQLKSVNDSVSVFSDSFDFKDGSKHDVEYFYDANDNLIKDLNKEIVDIQYNYLNLPCRIEFANGNRIILSAVHLLHHLPLFSRISIMARNWIEKVDWIGMITGRGIMMQC